MKVRSALAVKRANGEYGGSFYCYGYEVDPADKNKYLIDDEAAEVVRKIYRWTFDGIGISEIARRLNMMHILCPMEYKKKKRLGNKYIQGPHEWNIYQIFRMLRNDVYTGTLRLGKQTTPNYKVKKVINKPEEEQFIFKNHHEAIISESEFNLMQNLLSRDSRMHNTANGTYTQVYPLVGYIFCADCGGSMHVKTSHAKGNIYKYYVCGVNKNNNKLCSTHSIQFEKLNKIVLDALNVHLKMLVEVEEVFHGKDLDVLAQPEIEKLQVRIGKVLEKKFMLTEELRHLDADFREGILHEVEYRDIKADYLKRIKTMEDDAAALELQKKNQIASEENNMFWIRKYRELGELKELTRRDVVTFIDRVEVKDEDHIAIRFRFGDEYQDILHKINRRKGAEKRKQKAAQAAAAGLEVVNG